MKAVALKFPGLVAATPMRTHAILTKYPALRSFQILAPQFTPLRYEHATNYSSALQEAYLDYKNMMKDIRVLSFDVATETQTLRVHEGVGGKEFAENSVRASTPALLTDTSVTKPAETEHQSGSETSLTEITASDVPSADAAKNATTRGALPAIKKPLQPLVISQPYPPTVFGLEAARVHCRFIMNRIVSEVDLRLARKGRSLIMLRSTTSQVIRRSPLMSCGPCHT